MNCRWVLTASDNEHIHIKFVEMNMENSNLCSKDWLSIQDTAMRSPIQQTEANSSLVVSSNRASTSRWFRVRKRSNSSGFVSSLLFNDCNKLRKKFENTTFSVVLFCYCGFSAFQRSEKII